MVKSQTNLNTTPKTANSAAVTCAKQNDDNSFTLVSYRRQQSQSHSTRTAHTVTQTKAMIAVKLVNFPKFQENIFNIIERIVNDNNHQDHPSVKLWKKGTTTITAKTSFRSLSKLLNITNLSQYKTFLGTLPNIGRYLILADDETNKSGFQYNILPVEVKLSESPAVHVKDEHNLPKVDESDAMTTGRDQHSVADTNSLTTTKSISNKEPDPYESWQSCYGTSTDLKEMLTHFWPHIQRLFMIHLITLTPFSGTIG
jgi:hypothetical protein